MRTSTVFTLRAINVNQLAVGPLRQVSHNTEIRADQVKLCPCVLAG